MNVPAFDTLLFADALRKGEFSATQAETLARAINQTLSDANANVATRADLAALETRIDSRLSAQEARFDAKITEAVAKLETALYRQHLTVLVSLLGLAIALGGLIKFVR